MVTKFDCWFRLLRMFIRKLLRLWIRAMRRQLFHKRSRWYAENSLASQRLITWSTQSLPGLHNQIPKQSGLILYESPDVSNCHRFTHIQHRRWDDTVRKERQKLVNTYTHWCHHHSYRHPCPHSHLRHPSLSAIMLQMYTRSPFSLTVSFCFFFRRTLLRQNMA